MEILTAIAFSSAALSAGLPIYDSCAVFGSSDTSAYVLPYPPGKAYEVWQTISWHDRAEDRHVGRYAIDFKMPIGSRVTAAREGIVVAARDSFRDGNGKDLEE